MTIGNGN
ncbi:hypothetical protein PMI28_05245 [Pseudomonas sp. GM48]|nr:hypothetical protein PMI28_05245 [Pseudomonas sp. GM48]